MNDHLDMPAWVIEAGERQAAEDAKQNEPLALCQETLARQRNAMKAMSGIVSSWSIYKGLADTDIVVAAGLLARVASASDVDEQRFLVKELWQMAGYEGGSDES
jgi:hypothetical protein